MITNLTINKKDYKCVLSAGACVQAEQKLGMNPISIFFDGMPKMGDLLVVFWASLQKYNHGISMEDTYDIYDEYIADGHSLQDFTQFIMDLYKDSGFITTDEAETKNA